MGSQLFTGVRLQCFTGVGSQLFTGVRPQCFTGVRPLLSDVIIVVMQNECVSRPGLPTPIPPQDEYLEPGKGEWSGPTEDYIEIPVGVDANHNCSAPPLPSDGKWQKTWLNSSFYFSF